MTADLEHRIARVLTVGTWIGVALLGLGVVGMVAAGIDPLTPDYPVFDLAALPSQIAGLEPIGALWLGLIVILATPPLRVATALVGYAGRGERRMAFVSAGILLVIAVAIVAGLAGA